MQFEFATAPRTLIKPGILREPAAWGLSALDRRWFIVTDPGVVNAGIARIVSDALTHAGAQVTLFDAVEADPPEARVMDAVDAARAASADIVMGLGGGSSMDTAKLVALLAATPQPLETLFGMNLARGPRLPLVQVPTTAGTGSEVTPIAIVTTQTHEKKGIVSPLLYPDLALLDATLTLGLPPTITAMTGIDAMVHAIEAYTSKLKKNPMSDALAREALRLLHTHLPIVLEQPRHIEARSAMLAGSMMAGMAFANAPVAAVHALAYPLGGHFHVPHGLSNALVLIPVLHYNLPEAIPAYAELAAVVDPEHARLKPENAARAFIETLTTLMNRIPLPKRLSDVGVDADDLDRLADDAMKIERLLVNNPRVMTREAARAIYLRQL